MAPTCHASVSNTGNIMRSGLFQRANNRSISKIKHNGCRAREGKGRQKGFVSSLWPYSRLSTSLLTSTIPARLLRVAAFFPTSDVYERVHFSLIFNPSLLPFISPVFLTKACAVLTLCPLQPQHHASINPFARWPTMLLILLSTS